MPKTKNNRFAQHIPDKQQTRAFFVEFPEIFLGQRFLYCYLRARFKSRDNDFVLEVRSKMVHTKKTSEKPYILSCYLTTRKKPLKNKSRSKVQ